MALILQRLSPAGSKQTVTWWIQNLRLFCYYKRIIDIVPIFRLSSLGCDILNFLHCQRNFSILQPAPTPSCHLCSSRSSCLLLLHFHPRFKVRTSPAWLLFHIPGLFRLFTGAVLLWSAGYWKRESFKCRGSLWSCRSRGRRHVCFACKLIPQTELRSGAYTCPWEDAFLLFGIFSIVRTVSRSQAAHFQDDVTTSTREVKVPRVFLFLPDFSVERTVFRLVMSVNCACCWMFPLLKCNFLQYFNNLSCWHYVCCIRVLTCFDPPSFVDFDSVSQLLTVTSCLVSRAANKANNSGVTRFCFYLPSFFSFSF